MKLAALLSRLPEEALRRWQAHYMGDDCARRADKEESGAIGLVRHLSSREVLKRGLEALKPWMGEILKLTLRSFGPLPFESEQLEKAALKEGYSGAQVTASLAVMRRRGIVFALRKGWGEELFLIPEDALAVWQELLFPGGLQEARADGANPGEPVGSMGCAAYDVLTVCRMASGPGLKSTRQGALAKASLRQLEDNLILANEDAAQAGPMMASSGDCGPALAVVLTLAIRSGLLSAGYPAWRTRSSALHEWLERSIADVGKELYGFWIEISRTAEVWELHALACLERADAGRWYLLDHLFEWLWDCGMIQEIGEAESRSFVESRLLPMQALGWLRLARLQEGLAFCLTIPVGSASQSLPNYYSGIIVQPDYEIVVPPYPRLKLLWTILLWSEPVGRGVILTFRLTRDSVRRAVEQGEAVEELLMELEAESMVPLDDRLKETVREWAARCGEAFKCHEEPPKLLCPEPLLVSRVQDPDLPPVADLARPVQHPWRDAPVSWRKESACYHPSTQKEMIKKAIEWKAALLLTNSEGEGSIVVPMALREAQNEWLLEGMSGSCSVMLRPEDWKELRLVVYE